jgi:hypothetical protein
MDIPLFHRAVSQGEQIAATAEPVNVPDRLRRRVLCDDLQKGAGAAYYGEGASLAIYLNGKLLNPYQIQVADLAGADGSWANLPASNSPYAAVIDPELGRIALAPSAVGTKAPDLALSYYYGFNANMGGGEYSREEKFLVTDPAWIVSYPDPSFIDLQHAINQAISLLGTNGAVALELDGSVSFTMTAPLAVDLPAGKAFEFRAAAGVRATILLDGELAVTGGASSIFVLNGLILAASPAMTPASPNSSSLLHLPVARPSGDPNLLSQLSLADSTLVPGWSVAPDGTPNNPSSSALLIESAAVSVSIATSIVGAIRTSEFSAISLSDSVLDASDSTQIAYAAPAGSSGSGGGGALTMTGCTIVGKVHATLLSLVSNCIFRGALLPTDKAPWVSALVADRRQEGCVRFSFLPINAVIPRPFECVYQALASPQPYFFAVRYGRPAYLKLLTSTSDLIRRGADDGGEMGAYHSLLAPQRESDLQIRMNEYLPVGLEFGLIYEN